MPVDMAAEDQPSAKVIALRPSTDSKEDHRVVLVLRDIEQMYNPDCPGVGLELGTIKPTEPSPAMLREILETVLT